MSFRYKTIIGIAIIEAILLIILIWNALLFLHTSTEDELIKRADTTTKLVATLSRDAVISNDLVSLDSFLAEVLENPGIVYVRIRGRERILAETGEQKALQKTFDRDEDLEDIDDGVFDTSFDIIEVGNILGRVEVGIDVRHSDKFFTSAKRKISLIAFLEMALCAVFSFFLGSLLVRQLQGLKDASERIAAGELDVRVNVTSRDEIGKVAVSFNLMAESLKKDNAEREKLIAELQGALEKVKILSGLVPICANCKKIRDDQGYWSQIESYIQKYSEVKFSHGMCPECSDKLYGDQDWYIKMKKEKGIE